MTISNVGLWRNPAFAALLAILCIAGMGCGAKVEPKYDRSTPKQAAAALLDAISYEDADQIGKSFANGTDPDYIAAMTDIAHASAKLRKAAETKWDPERAKQLEGDVDPVARDSPRYQNATENKQPDGSIALQTANGESIMLKHEGSEWKVDPAAGHDLKDGAARMRAAAKVLEAVAADVAANKFNDGDKDKNIRDVRTAIQARLAPAMKPAPSPE